MTTIKQKYETMITYIDANNRQGVIDLLTEMLAPRKMSLATLAAFGDRDQQDLLHEWFLSQVQDAH